MPTLHSSPRRPLSAVTRAAAACAAASLLLTACSGQSTTTPSGAPSSAASSAAPESTGTQTQGDPDLSGPSAEDKARAKALAAAMTPSQKAGAVLVQEYYGTDPGAAAALAQRLHLGGTILMGDNIPLTGSGVVDIPALRQTVAALKKPGQQREWGSILTIDQEGGTVARLRAPLTEWPTPMTLGAAGDEELTRSASKGLNAELAALGITLNNSTVADATIGAADPTIGSRSFGEDPELVGTMAVASAEGAAQAGVVPVIKHFPGHGSLTADSHLGLPVQDKSLAELTASDFVPFQKAIDHGVGVIMMGHIAVPALEQGVPSSLSAASYKQLRSMGFEGVIMTDALNMGAITAEYGSGEAAVRALAAGADLLLMPADVEQAHAGILSAVSSGRVPQSRLTEAAEHVIALGLWQKRLDSKTDGAAPGAGTQEAVEATVRGATVLTGSCSAPILTGRSVQLVAADAEDAASFRAAAAQAGITVGSTGPTIALAGYGDSPQTADVVVATDGPWVLANSQATTKLALYSATPEAFTALMTILTAPAKPTGRLTTAVGSNPRGTGC